MLEQLIRMFARDNTEVEQLMTAFRGSKNRTAERQIDQELKALFDVPPRIAVIGKTGVGKSSTINALFNPKKPVRIGHVVATTKKPKVLDVAIDAKKGKLSIIDLPGLGESLQADEKYIPMYQAILPTCDVILWVLKASDRVLAEDQRYIRDVLTEVCRAKLVIGLNQVDTIQPGTWIEEFNVPSRTQVASIERKTKDVRKKFSAVGVNDKNIVPYSARRRYRLPDLFRSMIDACPDDREWVLSARMNLAPYTAPAYSNTPSPNGAVPPSTGSSSTASTP